MLLDPNKSLSPLALDVIRQLITIYDPEMPVNIYDLGIIYDIEEDDARNIKVTMTLTSPNCPSIDDMINEIVYKVNQIEGIGKVDVNITFDPPWDSMMMSEEAQLMLGFL